MVRSRTCGSNAHAQRVTVRSLGSRGAYGVRYLFVTCDFSLAETENLRGRFSWDKPLKRTIWSLFDIAPKCTHNGHRDRDFCRLRTPNLIPFWAPAMHAVSQLHCSSLSRLCSAIILSRDSIRPEIPYQSTCAFRLSLTMFAVSA